MSDILKVPFVAGRIIGSRTVRSSVCHLSSKLRTSCSKTYHLRTKFTTPLWTVELAQQPTPLIAVLKAHAEPEGQVRGAARMVSAMVMDTSGCVLSFEELKACHCVPCISKITIIARAKLPTARERPLRNRKREGCIRRATSKSRTRSKDAIIELIANREGGFLLTPVDMNAMEMERDEAGRAGVKPSRAYPGIERFRDGEVRMRESGDSNPPLWPYEGRDQRGREISHTSWLYIYLGLICKTFMLATSEAIPRFVSSITASRKQSHGNDKAEEKSGEMESPTERLM
ncbi:hypothetical protein E6O75_ATG06618 [Venturia nashicola]|uniref:Uncharacterized protein n=1 Tax=Venturia nashicola TaxID=86259 RepID=A0A4Z1NVG2_9PEZI|nr:hypothetical protein E6O75_ATG06618 [Venturia nashicola]